MNNAAQGFPEWIRVTHWVNFLLMGFVIRAGYTNPGGLPPSLLERSLYSGYRVDQVYPKSD